MNKAITTLFYVAMILCLACTYLQATERITTGGSTSVSSIVNMASFVFKKTNHDASFIVNGGGSSFGIKAVGSGKITIGQSSRNLKEKEMLEYPDIVPFKIGMDGVAMVVNAKNPVKKITKQQVQDIYTGKITNWKYLGGDDATINIFSKEEGRSALEIFLKYFKLEAKVIGKGQKKNMVHKRKDDYELGNAHAKIVGSNKKVLGLISTDPYSIGYVSIGCAERVAQIGRRIHLLELDGIAATTKNVSNETYPLRRPLYVLTKGQPQGTVKEFIDFLQSAEGQKIVESMEFIRAI